MGNRPSQEIITASIEMTKKDVKEYFHGVWYEQARYYMFWEDGCTDAQATYSINEDGTIKVVNGCTVNGVYKEMTGKAKLLDPSNADYKKALFQVSFFPGSWGGYYIIYLQRPGDMRKGMALVVGHNFKYFWVLTRKKDLNAFDKKSVCTLITDIKVQKNIPLYNELLIWNDRQPCYVEYSNNTTVRYQHSPTNGSRSQTFVKKEKSSPQEEKKRSPGKKSTPEKAQASPKKQSTPKKKRSSKKKAQAPPKKQSTPKKKRSSKKKAQVPPKKQSTPKRK